MADIYDPDYVEHLFDEMSASYERVNYITSFGFSKRWRSQFVANARIAPQIVVCDLMCGMGECWPALARRLSAGGRLVALDLSRGMLKGAERKRNRMQDLDVTILRQDVLSNVIDNSSVDCVVSAFGIKTFSDEQKELLASEIRRILKPGGTFSLIEISVPEPALLRNLYTFYLKRVIPRLGKIFLGNPENYRMLGVYTERFRNCEVMREILIEKGFEVDYHNYFFGCATGVSGIKI